MSGSPTWWLRPTFVNPYGASDNPWDYGFILRNSLDNPFLQFLVSSDRQWVVLSGQEPPYDQIAGGTSSGLHTGSRGAEPPHGDRHWGARLVRCQRRPNGSRWAWIVPRTVATSRPLRELTREMRLLERPPPTRTSRATVSRGDTVLLVAHLWSDGSGNINAQQSGVWTRDVVVEAEFVNPSRRAMGLWASNTKP